MLRKEIKNITFLLILGAAVLALPRFSVAQYNSTNFGVLDPVIDSGQQSSTSLNFGLGQSLSQIAIGKSTSASFQLWSGFQYYFDADPNTLTATPDDGEVDLSWTVPTTYLGATVGDYEVGVGTTSGSYTFTSVGNVTNYTQTGLTNGTTYYFIIKALTPGGSFLVFSNEDSAAPNGVIPPPPPPSSGGGGFITSSVQISGIASPNALVTVVRDSINTTETTANAAGQFQLNLPNLTPGLHNFLVYATDVNGNKSSSQTFQETVASGITITVPGLLISPTITTNYSIVKKGETVQISGYAAPNASVVIRLEGQNFNQTYNVSSDATGRYVYDLGTPDLNLGQYSLKSYVTYLGATSIYSPAILFTVSDRTVDRPIDQCAGRSDFNCDGAVDLIDFSILLYFWEGANPLDRNPRTDIDGSGRVDIVDFSIMLYDWTG